MCRVRAEARQTLAECQSTHQEASVIRDDLAATLAGITRGWAQETVTRARLARAHAAELRAVFDQTRIEIEARRAERPCESISVRTESFSTRSSGLPGL
jgi:hypothetical protein